MTDDQVLAHVVIDPEAWKEHARVYAVTRWEADNERLSQLEQEAALAADNPLQADIESAARRLRAKVEAGPDAYFNKFLVDKVTRHRPVAEEEFAKPGYKARAAREADAAAERAQKMQEQAQARQQAEQDRQNEFQAAVAAEVARQLSQRP